MQHPNQTKKCPICREPFNPIQVMPNFGLLNYMAELRRNRSRSPRNLRARGSIGRVIHQPRTPPELISESQRRALDDLPLGLLPPPEVAPAPEPQETHLDNLD